MQTGFQFRERAVADTTGLEKPKSFFSVFSPVRLLPVISFVKLLERGQSVGHEAEGIKQKEFKLCSSDESKLP